MVAGKDDKLDLLGPLTPPPATPEALAAPTAPAWFLYLIECEGGRLYAGITNDLLKRFQAHAAGKGAAFTRINRPIHFVACRAYPDRSTASRAEAQLKKRDRRFKLAWAAANPPPPAIAGLIHETPSRQPAPAHS